MMAKVLTTPFWERYLKNNSDGGMGLFFMKERNEINN